MQVVPIERANERHRGAIMVDVEFSMDTGLGRQMLPPPTVGSNRQVRYPAIYLVYDWITGWTFFS